MTYKKPFTASLPIFVTCKSIHQTTIHTLEDLWLEIYVFLLARILIVDCCIINSKSIYKGKIKEKKKKRAFQLLLTGKFITL